MKLPTGLTVAMLLGLPMAPAVRADVAVEPATPLTSQNVNVRLYPTGDPACLHWTLRTRTAGTIVLAGTPQEAPCPEAGQAIALGTLTAGSYHVEARRPDDSIWGEVDFTVFVEAPDSLFNEALVRPARPTTADTVDVNLSLAEDPPCFHVVTVNPLFISGPIVGIDLQTSTIPFECLAPDRRRGITVHLPALAAGPKQVVVTYDGRFIFERFFTVEAATPSVLLGGRFEARVSWTDPAGATYDARPERLSERSAAFSFGAPSNVELTVKALDGRTQDGKYWIFAASLTDQPWELHVVDRASPGCAGDHCAERIYNGVRHHNANVLDTHAFDP